MRAIFHPEASEEMIESARFYEEKSEHLGSDFIAAIEQTAQRILQFPEAGRIERANLRKRLVAGFPFTILYELRNDTIFIAAIMHTSRRPGYWRTRLGK